MTNILLFVIILILLFGSAAILGAASMIFWAIAIISGAVLVIKIIKDDLREAAEKQERRHFKNEVRREQDKVERTQYELEHPGRTIKRWFGLYIEKDKEQGNFRDSSIFSLLLVTIGLLGLFLLAIIAVVIIKMFSSDTSIPEGSFTNQNGYSPTYSNEELKNIGK